MQQSERHDDDDEDDGIEYIKIWSRDKWAWHKASPKHSANVKRIRRRWPPALKFSLHASCGGKMQNPAPTLFLPVIRAHKLLLKCYSNTPHQQPPPHRTATLGRLRIRDLSCTRPPTRVCATHSEYHPEYKGLFWRTRDIYFWENKERRISFFWGWDE